MVIMFAITTEFGVYPFNFIVTLIIQLADHLVFFKAWYKEPAFYAVYLSVIFPVDLGNLHIPFPATERIKIIRTFIVVFKAAIVISNIVAFVTVIFHATSFILCKCRSKHGNANQ